MTDDGSKLYDMLLANEVGASDGATWANQEREVYAGEAMERELDALFPTDKLLDQGNDS